MKSNNTCKTWLCTLNNPTSSLEEVHKITKAKYTIGQLEIGEHGTKQTYLQQ